MAVDGDVVKMVVVVNAIELIWDIDMIAIVAVLATLGIFLLLLLELHWGFILIWFIAEIAI